MKIRVKLILIFTGIVASILITASVVIYFTQEEFRQQQFYERMKNRAINTARLFIEVKEIDSSLLQIIDQQTLALAEEKIMIFDTAQRKLYDSDPRVSSNLNLDWLYIILNEGEVRFRSDQTEWLGVLYKGQRQKFLIVASARDSYGIIKLENLKNVLIAVCFSSIIITLAAGWFFAGLVLKPISQIVTEVGNISASNLKARLNAGKGRDEVEKLAETFNNMLNRLESAFEVQRNFVSNSSHELRTPITALMSQIEVALIKERNADEYRKILRSLLDDIKFMSETVNGLLSLAHASIDAQNLPRKPIRIDELLWQTKSGIQKAKPEYDMSIDFSYDEIDERHLTIVGNEQLLETAFINLCENSCKYSADKKVKVLISQKFENLVTIYFIDNGIGISREDIQRIFEPFFRASNTTNIKGHGLGLALTHKIIDLHGGNISVKSNPGEGTIFTVDLPVA